jgi:hypothetical protein
LSVRTEEPGAFVSRYKRDLPSRICNLGAGGGVLDILFEGKSGKVCWTSYNFLIIEIEDPFRRFSSQKKKKTD